MVSLAFMPDFRPNPSKKFLGALAEKVSAPRHLVRPGIRSHGVTVGGYAYFLGDEAQGAEKYQDFRGGFKF